MILKKREQKPDRRMSPFIGALLFLISVVLLVVTGPLGFVYGLLHSLFSRGLKGVGEYLLKIAISVDQLGNVLMQHLLNLLWVKKGGYQFGNRDETISSALGRNRQLGTLTSFGLAIDAFLDRIDPQHSLNSIDYYIEPSAAVIVRLSWICILDNKLLFLRFTGQKELFLPGGHRDPKESDEEQLAKYLKDLLGIDLERSGFKDLGTYESNYLGNDQANFLRQHTYSAPFQGTFKPTSGLEPLIWVGYPQKNLLTIADQEIMEVLKMKRLLS